MNLFNKILIALCLFLAGALAVSQWRAEQTARKYLNTLAENGVLVQEREGVWSKLITAQEQITALQGDSAFRELRIRELLNVVKRKDARITALVAFQATWKPDTVTVPGEQDTVYVGTHARQRVTFSTEVQGDSVTGWTLSAPPEASISLRRRPVSFAVALIEGPGGQYETVLTSDNPYLVISAANGQVIPYDAHRGFLARYLAGPALSLGWSHERGVVAQARAAVWKIEPYVEAGEHGLDYGGRVKLWEKKW